MPRLHPNLLRGDVSTWGPPRGPRTSTGEWRWELKDRPLPPYFAIWDAEDRSFYRYGLLIHFSVNFAKWRYKTSQRDLAAKSGLSLSVLTAAINGDAWPKWSSLERMVAAVSDGSFIGVGDDDTTPLRHQLPHLVEAAGGSVRELADEYGMRLNTVYDILRDPDRDASSANVFAILDYCNEGGPYRTTARAV